MKKHSFFLSILLTCIINLGHSQVLQKVKIDSILNQKISIRALLIDNNKVWYAGNDNRFGFYNFKTQEKVEKQILNDTSKLEFRSIAQNGKFIFVANIGNPAYIFKIDKSDLSVSKVYSEINEKAFYDSMCFWNDNEGIAIGDPTSNCLSVLITRDGGNSWIKTNCDNLPHTIDGEAAFAASNTNICIRKNKTWIVSGGVKSRVFYSEDKGKSWQVFDTPIIQGKTMTGIFTADFYDSNVGMIAGGNYEVPTQNYQNKAISFDGGKNWRLIAENNGFGYASCVQFVPKSKGRKIIAVGALGIHYSGDGGNTWEKVSDDQTLFTIRFLDEHNAFAAGKNKIIRIYLNE